MNLFFDKKSFKLTKLMKKKLKMMTVTLRPSHLNLLTDNSEHLHHHPKSHFCWLKITIPYFTHSISRLHFTHISLGLRSLNYSFAFHKLWFDLILHRFSLLRLPRFPIQVQNSPLPVLCCCLLLAKRLLAVGGVTWCIMSLEAVHVPNGWKVQFGTHEQLEAVEVSSPVCAIIAQIMLAAKQPKPR